MKFSMARIQLISSILGVIFAASVAYAHIGEMETRLAKLESAFSTVPSSLARIEQKVDDLKGE